MLQQEVFEDGRVVAPALPGGRQGGRERERTMADHLEMTSGDILSLLTVASLHPHEACHSEDT